MFYSEIFFRFEVVNELIKNNFTGTIFFPC